MNDTEQIDAFLAGEPFAVVGASPNRAKYGNKVLRAYQQNDLRAFPIHPAAETVEGEPCFRSLSDLPTTPHGVSIITPPAISLGVVREAAELGIQHVWLQPGAEDDDVVTAAEDAGMNCIAGGPCLLVRLSYRETD